MKRFLCILFSVAVIMGCFSSCLGGGGYVDDDGEDYYEPADFNTFIREHFDIINNLASGRADINDCYCKDVDLDYDGYDEHIFVSTVLDNSDTSSHDRVLVVFDEDPGNDEMPYCSVFSRYMVMGDEFKLFYDNDGQSVIYYSSLTDGDTKFYLSLYDMSNFATLMWSTYCENEDTEEILYSDEYDFLENGRADAYNYSEISMDEYEDIILEYEDAEVETYIVIGKVYGFDEFIVGGQTDYNENADEYIAFDTPPEDDTDVSAENSNSSESTTAKITTTAPSQTGANSNIIKPTKEDLEKLTVFAGSGNYNRNSSDAVRTAYTVGLTHMGFYDAYADGITFAERDCVMSGDPDPLDLMWEGDDSYRDYSYLITPADSADRFLREIMGVEPDHNLMLTYDYDDKVVLYYYDGYYYSRFEMFGVTTDPVLISHSTDSNGIVTARLGLVDIGEDRPSFYTDVTVELIEINGEHYWKIYKIQSVS